ncbi:MAG: EAL domain-containing protein [Marinomonas sp.]
MAIEKGSDDLPERVRRTLVETLYAQPASLALGAINGIAATTIAAYAANLPILYYGAALLFVISAVRFIGAYTLSREQHKHGTVKLELAYQAGAFAYAMAIGSLAAMTLWLDASAGVQVLMVANALGYCLGISARNAARPMIAIGQLALACAPVMAVSILIGSIAHLALFVNILLLLPAMGSITTNVFDVLSNSITAAKTNERLADQMQELAHSDVLTGLANRAGLNHAMTEIVMNAVDDDQLALIWLDLDKFKEVNDLLGHPAGDEVLRAVAQRLLDVCGPEGSEATATVARFGGDEFIIFTHVRDHQHIMQITSEIHAEIMRPIYSNEVRIEVRASIGVAISSDHRRDIEALMQCSDQALYHAKTSGRAQTCFFAPEMTQELTRRRELEDELRAAILAGQLSVYFQPIVDLKTGKIRCFEALIRWFHPEKGQIRPDEFISIAEESGIILTLGNWITAQAAKAAAEWPEDVAIAVNLSPVQIRAPGATLGIINAMRSANLDPSRLILEVTESLFVEDDAATAAFIEDLSARGVKFALDDFGTGYSSLGYIHRYPFSKIKIDRSFVSGQNAGEKSRAIIRAVAEMGKQLDMEIVAEGLETADQVDWIKQSGCTMGQGYHYSPAVPADEAALLLSENRGHQPKVTDSSQAELHALTVAPKQARV